ncbi:MAG: tetratricopeptide repeat protein [Planctomycetota bacterium]
MGWFWYLGTLVPMIGLVQVGMQGLADRYTYFPQIGILLMFTWGLADLTDAIPSLKRVMPAAAAVVVAVLAALCWRQVTFWQNSGILFERVLAITDQNFSAYCCYGQYLYVNGKVDQALVYYEKALDVNPSYLKGQVLFADILVDKGRSDEALQRYQLALKENAQFIPARMGLGKFFLDRKMYSSAIEQFQKVLEIEPDNTEAKLKRSLALHGAGRKDETYAGILDLLKEQPKNSRLRATLGDIYAEEGKAEKAREEYEAAIRMNVREGAAYNGLGTLLARSGAFAKSVEFFEKAIENEPDNPSAYDNLGSALAALGKTRDAVVQFRKALEVKEGYPASANNLAWILATNPETSLRNGKEAVELLRSLCEGEKGEDPSYLDTLAAAYAETGNFPQAVVVASRAEAIAMKGGNAELAKQIESRRKLYEANQPFRG